MAGLNQAVTSTMSNTTITHPHLGQVTRVEFLRYLVGNIKLASNSKPKTVVLQCLNKLSAQINEIKPNGQIPELGYGQLQLFLM